MGIVKINIFPKFKGIWTWGFYHPKTIRAVFTIFLSPKTSQIRLFVAFVETWCILWEFMEIGNIRCDISDFLEKILEIVIYPGYILFW